MGLSLAHMADGDILVVCGALSTRSSTEIRHCAMSTPPAEYTSDLLLSALHLVRNIFDHLVACVAQTDNQLPVGNIHSRHNYSASLYHPSEPARYLCVLRSEVYNFTHHIITQLRHGVTHPPIIGSVHECINTMLWKSNLLGTSLVSLTFRRFGVTWFANVCVSYHNT